MCLTQRHTSRRSPLPRQPSNDSDAKGTPQANRSDALAGPLDSSGSSAGDESDSPKAAYEGENGTKYTQTQPPTKRPRPEGTKARNPFGVLLLGQTPTETQLPVPANKRDTSQRLKQFAYVPGVHHGRPYPLMRTQALTFSPSAADKDATASVPSQPPPKPRYYTNPGLDCMRWTFINGRMTVLCRGVPSVLGDISQDDALDMDHDFDWEATPNYKSLLQNVCAPARPLSE